MGSGFTEIGLVLFTTMAPAGAIAFIAVALVALFGWRGVPRQDRDRRLRRLSRYLIVPLGVAVVGLIASATQLGTPANALNAFRGIGRSPLSNEVTCSVIFLALAGVYWLTSFYERVPAVAARVWLVITCIAALIMVTGISCAYSIYTIPTWNSVFVPLNLWGVGLYGGPILAIATLTIAGEMNHRGYRRALVAVSAIALVGETVSCLLQNASLSAYSNGIVSGAALVPAYPAMIAAFAVLGAAGLIGMVRVSGANATRNRGLLCLCTLLAFLAIFCVRFAFYGLHMTLGM